MTLTLITPTAAFEDSYRSYIEELGDEERYPFPLDFDHHDFPAMLERIEAFAQGRDLPEGYVPSSTFWLVDAEVLIGVANLRHRLNGALRQCGGHIGLGIRPSRRGEGLGKHLMALTLEQALHRGMDELHVHCHKGNGASAGMILHNGGVLHSELTLPGEDHVIQRYRLRAQARPGG